MFRRLKAKSLQRKAWCMGSFLCSTVDEEIYAHVRHRLQLCGGTATRVKLSSNGWVSGGGRNMPSQFYGLDMISAVVPDTIFANVLLCVFRRSDVPDFPFETVAYKFDSVKAPHEFQQLFARLNPSSPAPNGGPAMHRESAAVPGRGTTGSGASAGAMPGRPTHAVMGPLAPDRWAAKDRATPRLFASRSLGDLTDDASASHVSQHRGWTADDDPLDDELPDSVDDNDNGGAWSTTSLDGQPLVLPADVLLTPVNGALDGAWWSENDEAASVTQTNDVGVAATFPDVTDPRCGQRRAGLDVWIDGNSVACQAFVLATVTKTPVMYDADDYDDDAEEFKWAFSSDEEDEKPEFDLSSTTAMVLVNYESKKEAASRRFSEDRTHMADVGAERVKLRYSRRVGNHVVLPAASAAATHHNRDVARPVSHKPLSRHRPRLTSHHVASHRPRDPANSVVIRPSSTSTSAHDIALVRRVRSDTSAGAAVNADRRGVRGSAAVERAVLVRSAADRRSRVESVADNRQVRYSVSH